MIDQKTHELKLKQPYFDAVLNGKMCIRDRMVSGSIIAPLVNGGSSV